MCEGVCVWGRTWDSRTPLIASPILSPRQPLNIVRADGHWALLDLDSACAIGAEPVGHKSSSAYAPPEAIRVDDGATAACVRSVAAVTQGGASYALVTAHPSFDVWSLGCLLYQVHPYIAPSNPYLSH